MSSQEKHQKLKWSEFKKLVESVLIGGDPEIDFILFDVDYDRRKLWISISKQGKLWVEG